jgi:hypothetical protein
MSLTVVAKKYRISQVSVCRLMNESGGLKVHRGNQEQAVSPTAASELPAAAQLACQNQTKR